jgi:branched-chain amino acid transport system permease protein
MDFAVLQLLNGLSYATTLFLMASGLTLIFGVTRIVNFAHGSFFMLGALFSAHWLVNWFPAWSDSACLYLVAIVLGALCAALTGVIAEFVLLRRLYGVPELYQLVATFGLSLALHDAMRWAFGTVEVFAPRFPGLKGSFEISGNYFPQYQAFTLVLGPLVWLGLHLLLTRTAFGTRLRAATQDRAMLAALGVNTAPLMLAAVALGCALAGLGGALQLPREPAHLQMDTNVVVETFVVVVTGGLGSIGGAFLAALLIGLIHSFGISLFPQATLVLVFVTMAGVLTLRPQGLLGKPVDAGPAEVVQPFQRAPCSAIGQVVVVLASLILVILAWQAGEYWQALMGNALILVVLGVSLQAMMALGGMVSFGHAAFFALGAYGAALVHSVWGWNLPGALAAACTSALVVAVILGGVLVRSSGVYLAMLSLALAQVVWATASQWVDVTGGDNGLIGLRLVSPEMGLGFYVLLVAFAMFSIATLGRLSRSTLGAALQAVRDAPLRASASGLPVHGIKYRVYVGSATVAGLAGGLFAAQQGAVFTSVASVATSVDALLVILLGGIHQLWGCAAGAAILVWAGAELGRGFDYWRGALGILVMIIMVMAPSGLMGWRWSGRRITSGAAHRGWHP